MLLERLAPSLADSGLSPEDQLSAVCRLLRSTWDVPRDGFGGPVDRASSCTRFVTDLWEGLEAPCDRDVVDEALRCARSRAVAFDPDGCVLVHGDPACANVLSVLEPRDGTVEGFVLIDPDPSVGDRAHDLGVALRDWCEELTAADRPAALLERWCRAVAYLERVSTGLHVCSPGAEDLGRPFLETAAAILAERA